LIEFEPLPTGPYLVVSNRCSRINIVHTWCISWDGEFLGHGNLLSADSRVRKKGSHWQEW
jgi:hypothetical protein